LATRPELPDKLFFKIGEVARIAGVKQYVLRFWETEFPSIRPQKSKTNQRLYSRRDVETVLAVKHLLHERKFTIEGARRHLAGSGVVASLPPVDPAVVAASARREAAEEMATEVERARAETAHAFHCLLLDLRSEIQGFLARLEHDRDPGTGGDPR
jgi:DNA-binding transcriptional MerR regulator